MPENITGIDILSTRVELARTVYPSIQFVCCDASKLPFEDESFDIIFESTMFVQLIDNSLSETIASEMIRVCRKDKYIILVDWRIPKPWDKNNYCALTSSRRDSLFRVKQETRLIGTYPGALVPPIGRTLSTVFPSMYFMVARIFPMLVGQVVYVLQKA